ncbi:LacI family DNA-binding transcriptional regulator [Ideonella sp. DXS29W]|uniref:LacI family DNA-binding transcriptional regulator n=1 Tax=Ideonella lacteola TaxID=2984193 RepID=A0ABU9BPC3_9BURK
MSSKPPDTPADRRRLQMADIARLAGVSMSTVSRALNGSTLVNEETRRRIGELARSLNYTINESAKNLRLQRNQTIAVVVPYDAQSRQHISDPFFLAMVGSLADALTDRGYDMLLSRVDAEALDSVSSLYDVGRAIGIVLIGQWRHHDQLNALAARGVPVVVWGGQLPQQLYCTVGGDNELGGRLATRHLLDHGRRRILFLGDAQLPEVALRLDGYRRALAEVGVSFDEALVHTVPFEEQGAVRAIDAVLAAGAEHFDAVFACSDLLAILAMRALRRAGRRVPDDVAVIGYDDIALAAYAEPPLSTIHQPVALAGVELVDALTRLIGGEPQAPRQLPVNLVVRHSSSTGLASR